MIEQAFQWLAGGLMLLGAAFGLLGAVGVLRFPDLYTRLHAASKAGLVGAGLVLLAAAIALFDAPVALRAMAAIVFLALTTPIAAHLLARAGLLAGVAPANITDVNDLEKERHVDS